MLAMSGAICMVGVCCFHGSCKLRGCGRRIFWMGEEVSSEMAIEDLKRVGVSAIVLFLSLLSPVLFRLEHQMR